MYHAELQDYRTIAIMVSSRFAETRFAEIRV